MMIPTTLDRKTWKKWLLCPILAALLVLSCLPVYAGEQQTEQTESTETPTVTQDTCSESAKESTASSEQHNQAPNESVEAEQNGLGQSENAVTATSLTETPPYEGQVLDGGYVGFKNKATSMYLTIPNGATSVGTNVCQQSTSTVPNAQEFYLDYTHLPNKNVSYFTIYPVDASTGNAASTRVKSAAISSGTANVSLQYFMPTEMTDRWQIKHAYDNYYYIYIANRPDATGTKYALASGGLITDSVYVEAYTGSSNQLWLICADGAPININSNDITQGTEQIVEIGDTVEYYYVPKTYDCSVAWHVQGSAYRMGSGKIKTTDYGSADIFLEIEQRDNTIIEESSCLRMMYPDGECYYIQNVATKRYVNCGEQLSNGMMLVEQMDYLCNQSQKWELIHDNNNPGYVKFRSLDNNLYIVSLLSDGLTVALTSTQSDGTLWKINTSATGNRVLVSKLSEDSNVVLKVPFGSNGNGVNLVTTPYSNDTNFRDEWNFFTTQYSAELNSYFDNGYSVFYSETSSISTGNIEQYSWDISERYMQLLGLELSVNTPEYYASPLDSCKGTVNAANVDQICNHFFNLYSHSNRINVINDFLLWRNGNNCLTSAFWTCHRIESTNSSGSVSINRSCSSSYSIFMLERSTVGTRYVDSTGILMHELNHQYGARDHYHELDDQGNCKFSDICSVCGENPRSEFCIMNNSRQDITAATIICNDCINDILEHLNDHHD